MFLFSSMSYKYNIGTYIYQFISELILVLERNNCWNSISIATTPRPHSSFTGNRCLNRTKTLDLHTVNEFKKKCILFYKISMYRYDQQFFNLSLDTFISLGKEFSISRAIYWWRNNFWPLQFPNNWIVRSRWKIIFIILGKVNYSRSPPIMKNWFIRGNISIPLVPIFKLTLIFLNCL